MGIEGPTDPKELTSSGAILVR